MRQPYLDATDLRIIDELANELRRASDTEETFQMRRRKIFDLYMDGIQSRERILRALRDDAYSMSGTSPA